ncbi:hypothetical protein LCGC14_0963220, partial [marine sediment metagenome]
MRKYIKLGLKLGSIILLILLVNLSTFITGGVVTISSFLFYNFFAISIVCYIYIVVVLGTFLVTSFRSLWFNYKLERSSQYQKVQVAATISSLLTIFFIIFMGILIFVYNFILLAFGIFFTVYIVVCIIIPNSLRKPVEDKESSKPWIAEKNRCKRINLSYGILKGKNFLKRDKQVVIKALALLPILIISTLLGFFAASLFSNTLNEPKIAVVPQEFRRGAGIEYDVATLDYFEKAEDLEGITFNSMFILKFTLTASSFKSTTIHAELIPMNVTVSEDLEKDYKLSAKTLRFTSKSYQGPFSEKDIYFGIDLNLYNTPVFPGKYKLNIFSIVHEGFFQPRISNNYTYDITIEKDSLSFNPLYLNDPLKSTRRGNIYSIYNAELLGWDNHFDSSVQNSLGDAVSGNFSLYLTQREGNDLRYKKVTNYITDNTGIISYMTQTRTHYREYMRGKIIYDGTQSLWYKNVTLFEDSEIAKNKFIHTAESSPGRLNDTYNGLNWTEYNKNEFRTTNHLYYHTEFNMNEVQWTKDPTYNFDNGPPDLIYLDVSDDLTTYIESTILGYIGTIADIAKFSYRYEFYNYGTPSNDIWVDLTMQVFRDEQLVYERTDFSGYYNTQGTNWQTIYHDLTEFFTEAGQLFQIKIKADFDFDPAYSDDISIRFDWATLEGFYPPTYARLFDFEDGFNQFASPLMGSSQALYWDSTHPIALGNDILAYSSYSGLSTNNYFSSDFRLDDSWDSYSGLFKEGQEPEFERNDGINLGPTWRNEMAVFDLSALNPPVNVSSLFQSVIKDEFISMGDSDATLNNIRQRFVVPKVVSNNKYVIIVFAGRYSTDDQWKVYLTYATRPDGEFSTPFRIYDPGDDSIYQLAPSLALSETDLYITWQQRNRDTHPNGETEWNIMYGRVSLSDFVLKDIKNVTTYSPSNLDKSAFIAPDIALTPKSNVYDGNENLLMQDCIVHISFENATWTNLTPGSRNNEDVNDLFTNIYYTNLNSSYFGATFNTPEIINDLVSSPGESINSYIKSIEYIEMEVTGTSASFFLTKNQSIDNSIPFMSKTISSSTSDDWDDIQLDVYFDTFQTTPLVIAERSQSDGSVKVGIFVVEFDPTYINVQQGVVSFSGISSTDSITSVDLNKTAMMFYYKHLNDQDDWNDLRVRGWFSADNTLSWERDASSGDVYGHFYVFEAINDEFTVQSTSFSIGSGQTSNTGSFTNAVNTSKTIVIASFESTNGNDNANDGSCDVWLESSTSVKAQRYDNDGVIYIDAFVIEFNGDEEVQRGVFNYPVNDGQESVNIDPINLNSSIIQSSVFGGQIRASQAGSSDVMRAWQKLKFLDSNTIQGETHVGGRNVASGHWEVIDWNFSGGPSGTIPNNRINFNGNLETPQIVSQVSSNTSIILENSTDIFLNFNQTNYKK